MRGRLSTGYEPPKLRGRVIIVAAFVVAAILPLPVGAQTTIGTFEGSVPIETTSGDGTATSRVVVEAEEPGWVTVTFDDVVLSRDGSWELVEFGSTPYSLQGLITSDPVAIRYASDMVGARRTVDVTLRIQGSDDRTRAGFVTYTFVPDSARTPEPGVRQGVAARVRLGEWPADLDGIPAEVMVANLRLVRDSTVITGFVDRLIPDLPRVISRGPALITARTTNTGDVLVQSQTTLRLDRLPITAVVPFLRPAGITVVTYVDRPRLLLPLEEVVSSVASTASLVEGEEVDRLPFLGFVRVSAETSAYLGASRDDDRLERTYLVAPWKEALVGLLAYRALRASIRRLRRSREQRAETKVSVASAAP